MTTLSKDLISSLAKFCLFDKHPHKIIRSIKSCSKGQKVFSTCET